MTLVQDCTVFDRLVGTQHFESPQFQNRIAGSPTTSQSGVPTTGDEVTQSFGRISEATNDLTDQIVTDVDADRGTTNNLGNRITNNGSRRRAILVEQSSDQNQIVGELGATSNSKTSSQFTWLLIAVLVISNFMLGRVIFEQFSKIQEMTYRMSLLEQNFKLLENQVWNHQHFSSKDNVEDSGSERKATGKSAFTPNENINGSEQAYNFNRTFVFPEHSQPEDIEFESLLNYDSYLCSNYNPPIFCNSIGTCFLCHSAPKEPNYFDFYSNFTESWDRFKEKYRS